MQVLLANILSQGYYCRMDIKTWLDNGVGRASRLAEAARVKPAAVAQWKAANRVPLDHVRLVHELSKGEVGFEDMLPAPHTQETHHAGA